MFMAINLGRVVKQNGELPLKRSYHALIAWFYLFGFMVQIKYSCLFMRFFLDEQETAFADERFEGLECAIWKLGITA